MTTFDVVFLGVLLISLFLGVWRGLVYEVLSLLGWPVAFIISKLYASSIVSYMPSFDSAVVRMVLAYAVLFMTTLLCWALIVWLIRKFVSAAGLGWLDRVLGSLFGLLRGVLIVVLMVWVAALTSLPEAEFWREAKTRPFAEGVALYAKSWLPDGIARHIKFGN